MEIGVLGTLVVRDGGHDLDLRGRRLRALLALLALDAGRLVPATAIAEQLWPGDGETPAAVTGAVQTLVSRLRKAIGAATVESGPGGYRLLVPPESVDAVRFERSAAAGHRALAGDPAGAAATLREALGLWRGPVLPDLADLPFVQALAVRMDALRLRALEDRMDADLALGRAGDVVTELEGLVEEYPLRERLQAQLLRALAAAGRSGEALAAFERARKALAEQFGTDPSPLLREAHLQILRADAEIPRPPSPPAAAATGAPAADSDLPQARTSFLGREGDLARLGELLGSCRVVTLVGPGGAGKTRLAVEAARLAASTHRFELVRLVPLAPVTDPASVPAVTLETLGVREGRLLDAAERPDPREATERLLSTLRERDALLLLDNCEHLVDAAATLADQLLAGCPRLHLLVTSREPLRVAGERLHPVPPLPLPDVADPADLAGAAALEQPGVVLFVDRARAVDPAFPTDAATVATVVEVCHALDGLPLAIELAAARLRSMPLDALADRLHDRFRLLSTGPRTAEARHRTLRAVVAWSWDLLTPHERAVAQLAATFPGGVATDLAAAAWRSWTGGTAPGGTPPEPTGSGVACDVRDDAAAGDLADALASLAEKSLLDAVPSPPGARRGGARYRMLETIREYAATSLDPQALTEARRAHAAAMTAFAEEAEPRLRGPDQLAWLAALNAERDNLLAALRFSIDTGDADVSVRLAAALAWYWTLRGLNAEAVTWLEQALAVPGPTPPGSRDIARVALAFAGAASGRRPSEPTLGEVERLAEGASEDAHPLLRVLSPAMTLLLGDAAAARTGLARHQDDADPWIRSAVRLMLGLITENDGDLDDARTLLTQAHRGFTEVGDRWGMATALSVLGNIAMGGGETATALAAYQEAAGYLLDLGGSDDAAETFARMAGMQVREGDLAAAEASLARARELAEVGRSPWVLAFLDLGTALLLRARGEAAEAERTVRRALAGADFRAMAPQAGAVVSSGAAWIALDAGDLDRARGLLAEAARLAAVAQDMPVTSTVAAAAAGLAAAGHDHALAATLLGAAGTLRGGDLGLDADPDLAQVRSRCRQSLGAGGFDARYRDGRRLDRAAATALLERVLAQV